MDETTPAVTVKPTRGREMMSKVVPTDIFEPIATTQNISNDKGERSGKGEIYHEGYVDGKLYLVPDSNLEAMKDIINFKMRPRRSTRYKHQTSFQISDFEHFEGRVMAMLEKVSSLAISSESEDEKVKELEQEEDKKVMFDHDLKKEQSKQELDTKEEESVSELSDETDKIRKIAGPSIVEPTKQEDSHIKSSGEYVQPYIKDTISSIGQDMDKKEWPDEKTFKETNYCFRFLISGYFNDDQTPMYITQEYSGPRLLENEETDVYSSKSDKGVDMFIAGKFFNTNILEECEGNPVALNTSSKRILIDKNKCKIYKESFKKVYEFEAADVQIKGEFIQRPESNKVTTPLLTLGVKRNLLCGDGLNEHSKIIVPVDKAHEDEPHNYDNKELQTKRSDVSISGSSTDSTIVLQYTPKHRSPFSQHNLQEE